MPPYIPPELKEIKKGLLEGKPSPAGLRVRMFLGSFGAQRRGFYIVQQIRIALKTLGLKTDPDFEYAYIDEPIKFLLDSSEPSGKPTSSTGTATGATAAGVQTALESVSPTTSAMSDPTYRIGKLVAANRVPVSVKPDSDISEAVTLMLINEFSQLPVMQSETTVKGVVSWQSIGARLSLGIVCKRVSDCMDKAIEKSSDDSLFAVIPDIVQHQYVLVRNRENRIAGIITTSDLSVQFGQLAEPFLLLSEIEQHIRRILQGRFSVEDLKQARDPADDEREVTSVEDLTFGEYIRLLEEPGRWDKLGIRIDRKSFLNQLQEVRRIRNDVMHFDPDGITDEERDTLRKFAQLLQTLQRLGAT